MLILQMNHLETARRDGTSITDVQCTQALKLKDNRNGYPACLVSPELQLSYLFTRTDDTHLERLFQALTTKHVCGIVRTGHENTVL